MSKRDRLEDIGRICEQLDSSLDRIKALQDVLERIDDGLNEDVLEEAHLLLENLYHETCEIWHLARWGDDDAD